MHVVSDYRYRDYVILSMHVFCMGSMPETKQISLLVEHGEGTVQVSFVSGGDSGSDYKAATEAAAA